MFVMIFAILSSASLLFSLVRLTESSSSWRVNCVKMCYLKFSMTSEYVSLSSYHVMLTTQEAQMLKEVNGSDLVGTICQHPFLDQDAPIWHGTVCFLCECVKREELCVRCEFLTVRLSCHAGCRYWISTHCARAWKGRFCCCHSHGGEIRAKSGSI